MPRPLHEIAREIRSDWKPVDYSAKPYLEAMMDLENLDDKYGQDDGRYIVNYFLSNSGKWRGDTAKRVKAELKQMVGRRASDDLATRVAMRHTAAGDIDVGTAITTVRGKTFHDQAVLRPSGYGKPGSYAFVVQGGGGGWEVEDFLRGSGPLYIDMGQDWVLVNADELRAEVRGMMQRAGRGGGSAVGAPPPEADGIIEAARDMRVAANSGNQMRVRRAMVAMLNEMAPFCDYLGESDVTTRFKLLARDLASRG